MEHSGLKQTEKVLRQRRRNRRWLPVILCLAVVIIVGTFYGLTKEGKAHSRSISVLDCPLQIHSHDQSCYDQYDNVVCGYADYVVHTHSGACYDDSGALVCWLPEIEEHHHDSSCYTQYSSLVCGQEESDGHQHSGSCYTWQRGELTCGQETEYWDEDLEQYIYHEHTDDCYAWYEVLSCGMESGQGAHYHSDSCYTTWDEMTCGKLENHTHTNDCYDREGYLICGQTELVEHVHSEQNGCFRTVYVSEEEQYDAEEAPQSDESAVIEVPEEEEQPLEQALLEDDFAEALALDGTQQGADPSTAQTSPTDGVDITNHVTKAEFTINNGVSWVPIEADTILTANQVLRGEIEFSYVSVSELQGSKLAVIDLPDLIVPNAMTGYSQRQALLDESYSSTSPAGYYYFNENGDAVVEFTDNYLSFLTLNNANVHGKLTFTFTWDEKQLENGDNTQVIHLGDYEGTVLIRNENTTQDKERQTYSAYDLWKASSGVTFQDGNNAYITYSVNISVHGDGVEAPLVLYDSLGDVSRELVQYGNSISCTGGLNISWADASSGNGKVITMGDAGQTIPAGDYVITYTVNLPGAASGNYSLSSITNSIRSEDGSHNTSVPTGTSRSGVAKSGSIINKKTGEVQWTIDVNNGAVPYDLQNETFTDTLPDGTSLKPGTGVVVAQYDFATGQLLSEAAATVSADGKTLSYSFPNGTYRYQIQYTTVQDKMHYGDNYVSNKAEIAGSVNDSSTSTLNIQLTSLSKYMSSSGKAVDYDDKKVAPTTWTVTIDRDTVSAGVTFHDYGRFTNYTPDMLMTDEQRSQIQVIDGLGQTVSPSDYTVEPYSHVETLSWYTPSEKDTGLFQITMTRDVVGPVKIIYTCYVDVTNVEPGSYVNVLNAFDATDETTPAQSGGGFSMAKESAIAKFTYGVSSEESKTNPSESNVNLRLGNCITWVIRVDDPGSDAIELTDMLPEGLEFVEGSVSAVIIPYGWGYSQGLYSTDLTQQTGNQSAFKIGVDTQVSDQTITFTIPERSQRELGGSAAGAGYNNEDTNENLSIYIFYQTQIPEDSEFFQGSDQTIRYTNTLVYGDKTVEHTATVTRTVAGKNGSYNKNTNTLNYTLVINPMASDLNPVGDQLTMVDTLSGGVLQDYMQLQSVSVFTVTTDNAGNDVPGRMLQSLVQVAVQEGDAPQYEDYTYTYDQENQIITAYLPDNTALALVYSYYVDLANLSTDVSVSNKATIYGGQNRYDAEADYETVYHAEMGGELSSSVSSVTIIKHSSAMYSALLSGAVYKLETYDPSTDTWSTANNGTVTTDDTGNARIRGIPFDTLCRLTEQSAPDGYVVDTTPYYFLIQMDPSTAEADEESTSAYWNSVLPKDFLISQIDKIYKKSNSSSAIERFNTPAEDAITVTKSWLSYRGNATAAPEDTTVTFQVTKHLNGEAIDYGTYTLPTDTGDWSKTIGVLDDGATYTVQEIGITQDGQYIAVDAQKDGTATVGQYDISYVYGDETTRHLTAGESAFIQNKSQNDNEVVITVEKVWFGQSESQAQYKVQFSTDGNSWRDLTSLPKSAQKNISYSGVLNDQNSWQETVTGLPKASESGALYQYRVLELGADSDYLVTYKVVGDGETTETEASQAIADEQTVIITNTSKTYTQLTVNKLWLNESGGVMSNPTQPVQIQLMQAVQKASQYTLTVKTANGWGGDEGTYTTSLNPGSSVKLLVQMGSEDAYQGLTIQGLNAEESFEPYYYNWQWYYSVDITMDGNRTIEFIAGANQWIATASNRGDSFLVIEEAPATVTDEAGVGEGVAYGEPVTVSRENGWSYIWTELPARTESGDPYVYTVSEISVNGVAVDQAPCLVEIVDEGNNVFTIKNTTTETMGYELPETGSTGHYPIYMAGALLVLSAGLMYMKRRQRKEGNG